MEISFSSLTPLVSSFVPCRRDYGHHYPSDSRSVHLRRLSQTLLPYPHRIGQGEPGIAKYPSTVEDGDIVLVRPAAFMGSWSRRRTLGS